jgi:hypothetical protein
MSKLIDDVKEKRYNKAEYALEDGSSGLAVELVPASVQATERTKIVALDDLKVLRIFLYRLTK